MTVSAVRQSDGNSRLNTIIKSTSAGLAGGYAMKWLWPVTKSEDTINRKVMINYCRKVTNKAKAQEFTELGRRTSAQDEFIKMVGYLTPKQIKDEVKIDHEAVKTAFKSENIDKIIEKLGGESSASGREFRNIIRNVNNDSKQMLRRFAISYHIMLKKIRQPIPFLVAGAGVGFFTGFARNVMKCDYDA